MADPVGAAAKSGDDDRGEAAAAAGAAPEKDGPENDDKCNGQTKSIDDNECNNNNDQSVASLGNDDVAPKPAQSDGNNNGNKNGNGNSSSKQRKAARWKQMNKKKKAQKRQKFERAAKGEGTERENKRFKKNRWDRDKDEAAAAAPHGGSFADEAMRKLFDVDIDPPSGEGGVEGGATTAEDDAGGADGAARVPKRKLAVLVAFLGSDYAGFQINLAKRTLQAEIELALYRAGIISGSNFGHPSKYGWSNSARTDKGVHAAAQVCSLKGEMIFHNDMEGSPLRRQFDAMRERVNQYLPGDVRVLDLERVVRGFCARTGRDKVRYQYMVPSYLLCSPEEVRAAFSKVGKGDEGKEGAGATGDAAALTPSEVSNIVAEKIGPEALARARDALVGHRVTPAQMERLREGLKLFEGTHSFHNYTRRVGADDASAARYILSFAPSDPILSPGGTDDDDDGPARPETQWIPLQVVGQSFLLNQIRKMVSAAVDHARGAVSGERIRESFSKQCRMKVNVAPAQGLFLDRSYFELYNKHKVKNAPKHGDKTPDRNELEWAEVEGEEMPAAVRRIEEFKNEKIIPHIIREEAEEGNFLKYLFAQDVLCKDLTYSLIEDGYKK